MFLNIQIDCIILKTYDQQFTLTTKKSLHIIFKEGLPLPATDAFIHTWNEPYLPLLPAAERRRTLAGTHFAFRWW